MRTFILCLFTTFILSSYTLAECPPALQVRAVFRDYIDDTGPLKKSFPLAAIIDSSLGTTLPTLHLKSVPLGGNKFQCLYKKSENDPDEQALVEIYTR